MCSVLDAVTFSHDSTSNLVDILNPYTGHHHGPHLSHDELVRRSFDSLSLSATYEIFSPPQHPTVTALTTVQSIKPLTDGSAGGRLLTIGNAFEHMSVYEPLGFGGCKDKNNFTRRATVMETSDMMHCEVSINAGYFNTSTGQCYGNIVSNGRIVQNTGVQVSLIKIK